MLGKLGRWLRVLGWDAEYVRDESTSGLIERAGKEDKYLLTRRRGVNNRRLIFIESEVLEDQLHQLEGSFKALSNAQPFSRCIDCNSVLYKVAKPEVKGEVPFFTFATFEEFYRCPACKKVFWRGSHHQAMLRKLNRIKSTSRS